LKNKMKKTKETKKSQNKKEEIYIDDGRTIADMNVEGMPWYDKNKEKRKKPERITFKEKMAVLWGAYRAYLPGLLIIATAMAAVYLLIMVWWG